MTCVLRACQPGFDRDSTPTVSVNVIMKSAFASIAIEIVCYSHWLDGAPMEPSSNQSSLMHTLLNPT